MIADRALTASSPLQLLHEMSRIRKMLYDEKTQVSQSVHAPTKAAPKVQR